MRFTRMYPLLVTALLGVVVVTQHRVWRLEAELHELRPALARIDERNQDTDTSIADRLRELAKSSELAKVERELAQTNDRLAAYGAEMRANGRSAAASSADAHAELVTLRRRLAP